MVFSLKTMSKADNNEKAHNEVSKFLSYVLRHQPEAIGLELDSEGWANIDALIAGAAGQGQSLDKQLIEAVVDGSDKKRFALSEDGLRIRAVQGHSTAKVDIAFTEKTTGHLVPRHRQPFSFRHSCRRINRTVATICSSLRRSGGGHPGRTALRYAGGAGN
jgi:RNA:NAD 2'-phosphotransferase (TPT1/KptA family)